MINKEVHDALSFLLNCSLKDKSMTTQKENFDIIFTYIKKLEQNNQQLKEQLKKLKKITKQFLIYLDKNKSVLNNPNILDFYINIKEILNIEKSDNE